MSDTHCGWLTKIGANRSSWKKRWFVLDPPGNELRYSTSQSDSTVKGTITIDYQTMVAKSYKFPKRKWTLEVGGVKRRTYYMDAGNEKEMNGWIEVISNCVRAYQEGAPGSVKDDASSSRKEPMTQAEELESTPLESKTSIPPGLVAEVEGKTLPVPVRQEIQSFDPGALFHPLPPPIASADGGTPLPPPPEIKGELAQPPPTGVVSAGVQPGVGMVGPGVPPPTGVVSAGVQPGVGMVGPGVPPPTGVVSAGVQPGVGMVGPGVPPPTGVVSAGVQPGVGMVGPGVPPPTGVVSAGVQPGVGLVSGETEPMEIPAPDAPPVPTEGELSAKEPSVAPMQPGFFTGFDPSKVALRKTAQGGRGGGRGPPPSFSAPTRQAPPDRVRAPSHIAAVAADMVAPAPPGLSVAMPEKKKVVESAPAAVPAPAPTSVPSDSKAPMDPVLALVEQANASAPTPAAEPVAEPAPTPVAEPVLEPVAEPVARPAAAPVVAGEPDMTEEVRARDGGEVVEQVRPHAQQRQGVPVMGDAIAAQLKERMKKPSDSPQRPPQRQAQDPLVAEGGAVASGRPDPNVELFEKYSVLTRQYEELRRANISMKGMIKDIRGDLVSLKTEHEQLGKSMAQLQHQVQKVMSSVLSAQPARGGAAVRARGRGGRGREDQAGAKSREEMPKRQEPSETSSVRRGPAAEPPSMAPVADGPPAKPAPSAAPVADGPPSKPAPAAEPPSMAPVADGPPSKPAPAAEPPSMAPVADGPPSKQAPTGPPSKPPPSGPPSKPAPTCPPSKPPPTVDPYVD